MTRWTMRATCWGWSLFYDGELVCSSNSQLDLICCQTFLMQDGVPA